MTTDGRPQDRVPQETARVWEVLVQRKELERWMLYVPDQPVEFTSLAEARAAAEETARTFSPDDPFSPVCRTVYRTGEDHYLVAIEGMTATFHFTVQVGERVAVIEY